MGRTQSITRRAVLTGAAASSAALAVPTSLGAPAPVASTAAPETAIGALYRQWRAVRAQGWEHLSAAASDASNAVYVRLQRRITAMTPVTPADLAMQIIVETDDNESEWRDTFYRRIVRLADGS